MLSELMIPIFFKSSGRNGTTALRNRCAAESMTKKNTEGLLFSLRK